MKIGDFDSMDRKFWPKNPEPGFSPEKNRQVIDNSIKKYEKQRARKMAEFTDKLRERTDAVATYLAGMQGVQRSRSLKQYFGKTYLAHLRGQDIRSRLIDQQRLLIKDKAFVKESEQKLAKTVAEGIAGKPGKVQRIKRYAKEE